MFKKLHTIKPDLITCPADSNRMWEERGRGRLFFSQFICGRGVPVALHSIFIEASTKIISFSVSSLLPLILGGTVRERESGKAREGGREGRKEKGERERERERERRDTAVALDLKLKTKCSRHLWPTKTLLM
jgi:hypothetical protein